MRGTPRPAPTPASGGAFVAPSGYVRPRGSSDGPREREQYAPRPAPNESSPLPGSRSRPAVDELKICGLAAVRARFARDPSSIIRLFFDAATGKQVGVICKVLAQGKKIYRQIEPAELERVAGSIHHGGIVAICAPTPLRPVTAEDIAKWAKRGEAALVLDRIGNVHNLGAIARTAAFFGVTRLILLDDPAAAKPSDAAHRVAEGGFEHLEVWQAKDLVVLARDLATAGFDVVGAATRGGRPDAAPKPGDERKPLALFLGNEEHGLAPNLAAACSRLVTIPGAGKVESLNVSVAAAVLLWELFAKRGR